ncbi:MAG TPA: LysM peptidoglycan-binding domain-containing M23 family metallopeptidase, partial [Caulobacteraceae bacterium]|nr:LysM peptidoglycan-binding domain-containing M23 family metallopeptidase [Caulobacteraceae bacterium]
MHDQTTPAAAPVARTPPVRQATASAAARPIPSAADPSLSITGDVVSASGGVFQNYEVQRGDHLDSLARAFSTSRQVLLDANRLRSPYTIHPGQIMKVPVAKAYVARSGDSLQGVARRFSVSVDELADLNHVSARGALRPGQEIGLPSSMRDRGPLRVTETQYAAAPAPAPDYRPPARTMTPETGSRYATQIPASQPPPRPTYGYGYQSAAPPASPQAAAPPQMSDGEIAQAAKGRFVWPLRGDMLVRFGSQGLGRRNDGIDIKASQGTPVKAAASGEVVYAGNQVPGFGNLVLIKHPDGWVTAYA